MKKLGVIGAGQMGSGISQTVCYAGFDVICFDTDQSSIEKAKKSISKSAKKILDKQNLKLNIDKINFTTTFSDLKQSDFVIEAVSENERLKQEVFSKLDQLLKKEAVICSNTSSISITKLASFTNKPDKVCGMHFMNPVPLMKLVEVIRGKQTSDETVSLVKELVSKMDKVCVEVKDSPGFVVNRILMPWINEAFFALNENLASANDIDKAMKLGTNVPMGPLTLADLIGLDTCLFIMRSLQAELGDAKRPCPLLVKYVEAGWLGRKTKKGVFDYKE